MRSAQEHVCCCGRTCERRWLLALIAGLGAGAVFAAWSAARRSASSFDRFLDAGAQPDFQVVFCSPDVDGGGAAERPDGCPATMRASEAARIRRLHLVRGRLSWESRLRHVRLRGQRGPGYVGTLIDDHDVPTFVGRSTRDSRACSRSQPGPSELVIPESVADLFDLAVGDRVGFTPTVDPGAPARGTARFVVVGIVRTPGDLVAGLDRERSDVQRRGAHGRAEVLVALRRGRPVLRDLDPGPSRSPRSGGVQVRAPENVPGIATSR